MSPSRRGSQAEGGSPKSKSPRARALSDENEFNLPKKVHDPNSDHEKKWRHGQLRKTPPVSDSMRNFYYSHLKDENEPYLKKVLTGKFDKFCSEEERTVEERKRSAYKDQKMLEHFEEEDLESDDEVDDAHKKQDKKRHESFPRLALHTFNPHAVKYAVQYGVFPWKEHKKYFRLYQKMQAEGRYDMKRPKLVKKTI